MRSPGRLAGGGPARSGFAEAASDLVCPLYAPARRIQAELSLTVLSARRGPEAEPAPMGSLSRLYSSSRVTSPTLDQTQSSWSKHTKRARTSRRRWHCTPVVAGAKHGARHIRDPSLDAYRPRCGHSAATSSCSASGDSYASSCFGWGQCGSGTTERLRRCKPSLASRSLRCGVRSETEGYIARSASSTDRHPLSGFQVPLMCRPTWRSEP